MARSEWIREAVKSFAASVTSGQVRRLPEYHKRGVADQFVSVRFQTKDLQLIDRASEKLGIKPSKVMCRGVLTLVNEKLKKRRETQHATRRNAKRHSTKRKNA